MNTKKFWIEFEFKSALWSELVMNGNHQLVFEEIDELAESCSVPFCFDITVLDEKPCLIFSPEGDSREAKDIDYLISQSPKSSDWRFFGRRQRKPLADVNSIIKHLYGVELSQVRFCINQNSNQIYVMTSHDICLNKDELMGLGNTFLWHAVGEELVMERGLKCESKRIDDAQTVSPKELVEMLNIEGGGETGTHHI